MPLWLTESGRPWKQGPDRPPIDQDQTSALDITMKGIESQACGIARYFPFGSSSTPATHMRIADVVPSIVGSLET